MNKRDEITKLKKKSIRISHILKDISKDIETLSNDLTVFPENNNKETPNVLPPAGHVNPIVNNAHVYFTNSLRRFW